MNGTPSPLPAKEGPPADKAEWSFRSATGSFRQALFRLTALSAFAALSGPATALCTSSAAAEVATTDAGVYTAQFQRADTGSTPWVPLDGKEPPKKLPDCIGVATHARYVIGYDHLVYVTNGCDQTAHCQVWTDVNPDKQAVVVRPKEKKTVLTFRGSPARVFHAQVTCDLEGPARDKAPPRDDSSDDDSSNDDE
jgi:hypothetical protein